jgi:antitoxin CptB|tara:strand:+ start:249 stop:542 length:294 start_codon:yes stop_codon:yes gene_type:complete
MTDTLDTQRKKLRIRAWRRGFKEADLILGRFCDDNIDSLDKAGLDAFEALLDQSDQDVYGWIIGREPVPAEFDTPVMARLKAFRVDADAAFGDGPKA